MVTNFGISSFLLIQRSFASRPTTPERAVGTAACRCHSGSSLDDTVALAPIWRNAMTTRSQIALALLAGFAIGAAAVQGLHAAGSAPAYVVTEVGISDLDAIKRSMSLSRRPRSRRPEAASSPPGEISLSMRGRRQGLASPSMRSTASMRRRRGATQISSRKRARSATSMRSSALSRSRGSLNKPATPEFAGSLKRRETRQGKATPAACRMIVGCGPQAVGLAPLFPDWRTAGRSTMSSFT